MKMRAAPGVIPGEPSISPNPRARSSKMNSLPKIQSRMLVYKKGEQPLPDIKVHVKAKAEVVDCMAEFDPHPFWHEHREEIIAESIITKQGPEYTTHSLESLLQELRRSRTNSRLFKKMVRVRKDFLSFGSWDLV